MILTANAKQYGLHLGVSRMPTTGSDASMDGPQRPPNSCYNQLQILTSRLARSADRLGFEGTGTIEQSFLKMGYGHAERWTQPENVEEA